MAMSTVKIQPLDWDSGILGLRCGLIDAAGLGCVMPPVLTRRILALCRKRDFDFIVIKMPANFSTSANSIIQAGASLIDTELSFRYCDTAAYEDNPAPGKLKVRFCRKIKGSALLPLAGGMRFSRYFNDPHIPRYKALQLWKDSIRNHCRGLKDQLLVAYYNDTPCGIVTLEFQDSKNIRLFLVAVLKRYRRKNIAKTLLKVLVDRYSPKYTIHVETQAKNVAAQNLYQSAGFRLEHVAYILHYWKA